MAKKKRQPAQNIINSTRSKRVKEAINAAYGDDAESKKTGAKQLIHGNTKRAVKDTVKNAYKNAKKEGKIEEVQSKKSPIQAALTATSKKALKELIKEPFRVEQEKQKALNKEYRKERNKLLRRIEYFTQKGYSFSDDIIPPRLEGNASANDIIKMRELRGKELKQKAISYTKPVSETYEDTDSVILDEDTLIADAQTEIVDPEKLLADEEDEEQDFYDKWYEDRSNRDDNIEPIWSDNFDDTDEYEDPQKRFYKENPDYQYAGHESEIEVGKTVLENAYAEIDRSTGYFEERPYIREDIRWLKSDGRMALLETLSKAEDALGLDGLAYILYHNADAFHHAVIQVLYFFDSKDDGRTEMVQSYSLTEINNILFNASPDLLMAMQFGDPGDI